MNETSIISDNPPSLAEVSPATSESDKQRADLESKVAVMFTYCCNHGLNVDAALVTPFVDGKRLSAAELIELFNHLCEVVRPARPVTLLMLEKAAGSRWRLLGAVPFIRVMGLVALTSLIALIALGTSTHIDGRDPMYDFSIQEPWRLIVQELFLLSAAALGASFAALFEANQFIRNASFEPRYESSYWVRFTLGVIAGFMLAMMIPVEVTDTQGGGQFAFGGLLHPLLALLGGYSSNLVHRVLNRLVVSLETIFKGSAEEQFAAKKAQAEAELRIHQTKITASVLTEIQQLTSNADSNVDELKQGLNALYTRLSQK